MRRLLAIGFVALGAGVAVTTEVLSLAGALNRWGIVAAWAAVGVGCGMWIRIGGGPSWRAMGVPPVRFASWWCALNVGLLACLVAGVAAAAVFAPPNTWDSMTYHMGRVAHWLQNESVATYPTTISRQLTYPPWAEFAIAQLQAVSGGDRLANLVQLGAYGGCVVLASLLAQALGAGAAGQILASAFAATLPMAIIQASGTQNDLVLALWIVCLMVVVLDGTLDRRSRAALAGTSLGLAVLTKFTGLFYGLPIVLWLLVRAARRDGWARVFTQAVPIVAVASLALNSGQAARGLELWQAARSAAVETPSSPAPEHSRESRPAATAAAASPAPYVNQRVGPTVLASNLIRNAGLHLALPGEGAGELLDRVVGGVHRVMGAHPNDPDTTYPRGGFRGFRFTMNEDDGGNPLHFLLILLTGFWLFTTRATDRAICRRYAVVVAAGALIFATVLKWQPWHSRLHLALFVLAAPLVAAAAADRLGDRAARALATVLLVGAWPWLLWNQPRPIAGSGSVLVTDRPSQYFANRPELEQPFRRAADYVRAGGYRDVGLIIGGNDWEYPLWVLLGQESGQQSMRIEHVEVRNPSRAAEARRAPFHPSVIISMVRVQTPLVQGGVRYERRAVWEPITIHEVAAR